MFAGPRFDNYKDGFRFGQLGYDLVEKRGLTRYQARTYMSFGALVMPWAKHVARGRELVRRAVDAAYRIGDLTFASYSRVQLITICLAAGDPLAEVQTEAENGLAFCQAHAVRLDHSVLRSAARPDTDSPWIDADFGVPGSRADTASLTLNVVLASNPNLATAEFFYWIRKLQARYFAGDYVAAVDASLNAQRLLWTPGPMFETAEFQLYSALAHAGAWDLRPLDQRQKHRRGPGGPPQADRSVGRAFP